MTAEDATDNDLGATDALALTVAFELVDGAFAKFLEHVKKNAARSVAHEPGCLRFDVLTPEGSALPHVLLYEIYADRAAFEHHVTTDHYQDFDRRTAALIRRKTVQRFKVTANAKRARSP